MSKIRVGLITVMSEDETWPDKLVKKFQQNHVEARTALENIGFEVISSNKLGRSFRQMVSQSSFLRAEGIDVLVLYVPDWSYANNAVVGSMNIDVPIIVWSDAHTDQNGIVGAAIIRGTLEEVGIKTKLIHGLPGDEKTLKELSTYCRGIAAATKLRNTKFGIGGGRSMGMYTAHVDPSELMKKFGCDIDYWDQIAILHRAETVKSERIDEMMKWVKKEFGKIEAKEEVLSAQISMYLALLDLIEEKDYDAVCVKCLPELPGCHTTFCLPIAILNDRSDHRGEKEAIVCGCEADVNGTLTMQIMKSLNGGPVMFTDVLKLYYDKNEIGMANCGSSPTDFAPSKKEVYWVEEGLLEFDWKMGGACPQYITRSDRITLARLSRIDGEYVMLLTSGETVQYPREKLKEINPKHPQSYVRLNCAIDDFIDELRCNHIHFVFGDFVREMDIACWVLGIRPIIIPKRNEI